MTTIHEEGFRGGQGRDADDVERDGNVVGGSLLFVLAVTVLGLAFVGAHCLAWH